MDGCTLDTEGEKEMVVKCLEAAIQRRVTEVSDESNQSSTLTFLSGLKQIEIYRIVSV